jgi:hypothetical protein
VGKEITKPERVMHYEGSKMSFLEYVDQLEAYVEKLEAAINYTRCCEKLPCSYAEGYNDAIAKIKEEAKYIDKHCAT